MDLILDLDLDSFNDCTAKLVEFCFQYSSVQVPAFRHNIVIHPDRDTFRQTQKPCTTLLNVHVHIYAATTTENPYQCTITDEFSVAIHSMSQYLRNKLSLIKSNSATLIDNI